MLIESAKVLDIQNESVLLEIQNTDKGHCLTCSASSACGHRLLSKLHPERNRVIPLTDKTFCGKTGDLIDIGIEEKTVLQLSLTFYLMPLMSMIISVLIFDFIGINEPWLIVIALIGLVLGFLGLGMITWNYKKCIKIV